jgi:hypothetical protein
MGLFFSEGSSRQNTEVKPKLKESKLVLDDNQMEYKEGERFEDYVERVALSIPVGSKYDVHRYMFRVAAMAVRIDHYMSVAEKTYGSGEIPDLPDLLKFFPRELNSDINLGLSLSWETRNETLRLNNLAVNALETEAKARIALRVEAIARRSIAEIILDKLLNMETFSVMFTNRFVNAYVSECMKARDDGGSLLKTADYLRQMNREVAEPIAMDYGIHSMTQSSPGGGYSGFAINLLSGLQDLGFSSLSTMGNISDACRLSSSIK